MSIRKALGEVLGGEWKHCNGEWRDDTGRSSVKKLFVKWSLNLCIGDRNIQGEVGHV